MISPLPDQPLITTDWLAEHSADPVLRLLDIRGHVLPASQPPPHYFNHEAEYRQSHIPGALFVDWVYAITDPNDPRHAPVAPPERYQELMRGLGINADTVVVTYDDAAGMFAARLWWTLHYYGHSQVFVLDGGWQKWIAEDRPVTNAISIVTPGDFVAVPDPRWRRTGDQVFDAINSPARLVDVRTPEEFSGKYARASRGGHIPGALNVPRTTLINPDGMMLAPDALRTVFAAQGIDDTAPEIVTYCNAGVSASYGLLALHMAGLKRSAVYDGSWKEWGNDPDRPIVL